MKEYIVETRSLKKYYQMGENTKKEERRTARSKVMVFLLFTFKAFHAILLITF